MGCWFERWREPQRHELSIRIVTLWSSDGKSIHFIFPPFFWILKFRESENDFDSRKRKSLFFCDFFFFFFLELYRIHLENFSTTIMLINFTGMEPRTKKNDTIFFNSIKAKWRSECKSNSARKWNCAIILLLLKVYKLFQRVT